MATKWQAIVEMLVDFGSIGLKNWSLFKVAKEGNLTQMNALIEEGADVNTERMVGIDQ